MKVVPVVKKKPRSYVWLIGLAIKSTKLLKSLKLLKILITPLSMFLSILIYGWSLGFSFAIGFVLLLFVHEMGHVIAMKIKGYPIKMPVFIPFLGAVIFAPAFNNREDEAFIGYGGPFLGGMTALALFGVWKILPQPNDILIMLSYLAVFINLFNLIPISPMDGGRVTKIIGKWFVWIGAAMLVVLIVVLKSPFIFLIAILALQDININPSYKYKLGSSFYLAMLLMILLGISEQGVIADVLDIFLALLFVSAYFHAHRDRIKGVILRAKRLELINLRRIASGRKVLLDRTLTDKPTLTIEESAPKSVRIKWLVLYLGLATFLVVGLVIQLPYLPSHLHK